MWVAWRNELREILWLVSIVGGLSLAAVSFALVLAQA